MILARPGPSIICPARSFREITLVCATVVSKCVLVAAYNWAASVATPRAADVLNLFGALHSREGFAWSTTCVHVEEKQASDNLRGESAEAVAVEAGAVDETAVDEAVAMDGAVAVEEAVVAGEVAAVVFTRLTARSTSSQTETGLKYEVIAADDRASFAERRTMTSKACERWAAQCKK
ncbi:hypothetical protein P171DRAFT_500887 [Karstenula rhodostoma CBS 690.94]|uniref:Uncharacterized protein n=1 Tax=Karstenula rhodostoma CBS 690.94 TaxID=1392251 RepID=A0A9P4U6D3_9PLEO|nr:hypothetical protein P171DRAFT_500887 [Karstenula rhodostoma CBS 690.94]